MSRLRSNVIALTVLQTANFALPLITLPYLTRVLGLENFGLSVLVQSVMQYLVMLTGWGFSLSATRKISAFRDDKNSINQIFSSVWAAQWFLLACALCVLSFVSFFLPRHGAVLCFCGFTAVVGNVLFPTWLLQGLERMSVVAAVQVLSRICIVPAYFVFVNVPSDVSVAVILNGGVSVLAGMFTVYWIYRERLVQWSHPSIAEIIFELKDGASVFASQTWISLYTTLTPIALGALAGTSAVGVFNLADKFRSAGVSMLSPLSQALFPRMSYLFEHDASQAFRLLRKSGLLLVVCAASGGVVLFLGSDLIISAFGGAEFKASAQVLRWLAPLPLIIVCSNICGIQIMLPLKKNRAFSLILGGAGSVSLLIMAPLMAWQGATGAAISTLITEICVTTAMAVYLKRIGIFQKRGSKHEG